jgi:phosphinothricin acetyltransferase
MGDVSVRAATAADAAAICVIYNQGIEDRLATLETERRTPDERREWLAARGPRHPVVLAESGGQAVGWASLNRFNPRPLTITWPILSCTSSGAGGAAASAGGSSTGWSSSDASIAYHKLVLAAFPFNAAGMALYERCGFRTVGVYREQGVSMAPGSTSSSWSGCSKGRLAALPVGLALVQECVHAFLEILGEIARQDQILEILGRDAGDVAAGRFLDRGHREGRVLADRAASSRVRARSSVAGCT